MAQAQEYRPEFDAAKVDLDQRDSLPGGWWILPSAVLGLAGWVGIFHLLGLL
jgi:hypothetical protein